MKEMAGAWRISGGGWRIGNIGDQPYGAQHRKLAWRHATQQQAAAAANGVS